MKHISVKNKIFIAAVFCILISVISIGAAAFMNISAILDENTQTVLDNTCSMLKLSLDGQFAQMEQSVTTLTDYVLDNLPAVTQLSDEQHLAAFVERILPTFRNTAEHTAGAISAYIVLNPDIAGPSAGLFLNRSATAEPFSRIPVTDITQYEKTDMEHVGWWYQPIAHGKPMWMNPYENLNINMLLISYVVPLFSADGGVIGILGMDVDFSRIMDFISQTRIYDSGCVLLLNAELAFITVDGGLRFQPFLDVFPELAPYRDTVAGTQSAPELFPCEYGGTPCMADFNTLSTGMKILAVVPTAELYRKQTQFIAVMLTATLAICAVMFITAYAFGARITTPIIQTDRMMQAIADGNGDLTQRISVRSNDEIGMMADHFNAFIGSINTIIAAVQQESASLRTINSRLQTTADQVASDAAALAENSANLHTQANEQNKSAAETSETVVMITQNIQDLAAQIKEQAAAVTQSSAAIEQMIANMNTVSANLTKASASFENLQQTTKDGQSALNNVQELVTKVSLESSNLLEANEIVNNIANQTNLLAMNAAIEAAHAGEAGKGFAVVSDEIRKLAEDSAAQSKNISANLNAIVKSIQEIVSATSHAEDSFSQMVKDISTSQDLVAQITLSVQEQNEGGKQVLQALGDIQAITIHIADSSSEMNQGTDRILHTLKRLTELSKQVQGNSDTMSRNTQNIHQSLALIHAVIESNDATVQKLNTHAGQFTV